MVRDAVVRGAAAAREGAAAEDLAHGVGGEARRAAAAAGLAVDVDVRDERLRHAQEAVLRPAALGEGEQVQRPRPRLSQRPGGGGRVPAPGHVRHRVGRPGRDEAQREPPPPLVAAAHQALHRLAHRPVPADGGDNGALPALLVQLLKVPRCVARPRREMRHDPVRRQAQH
eukprot:gene5744-biopygen13319